MTGQNLFRLWKQENGESDPRKKTAGRILFVIAIAILAYAAFSRSRYTPYEPEGETRIFLYGDVAGVEQFYEKEYELWETHYEQDALRDLFLELPYYEAQLLNLWMTEEDDTILLQWYEDIEGTLSHVEAIQDFLRSIKEKCPETVFHGTDIGYRYDTSGARYLEILEEQGKSGSPSYLLAQECIEQGIAYYDQNKDDVFREDTMAQNFIREYDALNQGSDPVCVAGFYRDAHCDPRREAAKGKTGSMASQLQEHYGDVVGYQAVESMVKIEADKMLEKQDSGRAESDRSTQSA